MYEIVKIDREKTIFVVFYRKQAFLELENIGLKNHVFAMSRSSTFPFMHNITRRRIW